jgi:uncharacterized iron-regulated protein
MDRVRRVSGNVGNRRRRPLRRATRVVLASTLVCLGVGIGRPAAADDALSEIAWTSPVARDHPLVGRIWQPAADRFADIGSVLAVLRDAGFILLGEKHDNVDHHVIQARLLRALAAAGRRPAVAFEMFTTEQEGRLAAHLARHPSDAAGLAEAVNWDWPDWPSYQPVVQAALDGGMPLLAASFPRATVRRIAEQGLAALEPDKVGELGLNRTLPAHLADLMRQQIVETHCRQLPDTMIGPMVKTMLAREAKMAAVLKRGAALDGRDGAVLIAGGGHVRTDHGVPWHLERLPEPGRVVAIAMLEVERGTTEPRAYARRLNVERLPYDFVWFTPRVDDLDPCERFAEQLRRAGSRGGATRPD